MYNMGDPVRRMVSRTGHRTVVVVRATRRPRSRHLAPRCYGRSVALTPGGEKYRLSHRNSVVAVVDNLGLCSDFKTFNVIYKFMCKTSCSMSLNQRPTFVIFTLETLQGNVLGRKKIGVKVCSCSKRDILKEEHLKEKRLTGINADNKHTSLANSCESSENKLKINNDNSEDKIYKLPALYLRTLELLHGHFLGSAIRGEDHLIDSYSLISMLADLIANVKSENNHQVDKADSESNEV